MNVEDEIDELFNEFESDFDRTQMARHSDSRAGAIQNKGWWECGIKFESSDAWQLFQMRAKKSVLWDRLIYAIKLLISGEYSIRSVAVETGMAKNTAKGLARKLNEMLLKMSYEGLKCKCGKSIFTHRGWCAFRYNKSEKRQVFIKGWRDKMTKLKV